MSKPPPPQHTKAVEGDLDASVLVALRGVSKAFAHPRGNEPVYPILQDLDLSIRAGELATFFGPNGSGKTSLLNMLAGLTRPDAGEIAVQSGSIQSLNIGYVFQSYAETMLPWRTVRRNLALPLEIQRLPRAEIRERVDERLAQFYLLEHANKYIYELSGGLKQLAAIARATIYDPQLLLLDEPFSALDYSMSRTMWMRFREFWVHQHLTTVFVSHDIDEAIFLGDRVFVLSARPARIIAEIPVPFGSHRTPDLLISPEFYAVRTQVLEAFEKGRQSQ